jgi:hypothetical protein
MNGEYIFSQYNKHVQYTCKLKFIGLCKTNNNHSFILLHFHKIYYIYNRQLHCLQFISVPHNVKWLFQQKIEDILATDRKLAELNSNENKISFILIHGMYYGINILITTSDRNKGLEIQLFPINFNLHVY